MIVICIYIMGSTSLFPALSTKCKYPCEGDRVGSGKPSIDFVQDEKLIKLEF